MQLLIGKDAITPQSIHRIAGGVQAVLKGEGLLRVLDAAMEGGPGIELLGGDLDRRPLQVAAIRMAGRDTHVTLICCGAAAGVH